MPVGSIRTQRDKDPASHIQIVPHPEEPAGLDSPGYDEDDVPVHTNPSYMVEAERVLDRHLTPHQRETSGGQTFADMARANVGRDAGEFMASSEPVPLGHYLKFTKPVRVKAGTRWKAVEFAEDESKCHIQYCTF